ncbi:MAG: helix-turn-helix domain-containing protein, partial [Candidatus Omnitrophota bacterium]|nr:helix-turn-helix domain-containing protein [Candidatus Omnitrophota bacterium]
DEFDNLEYLGIKNPFLGFGKVIMVQKDTMYIVASSRNEAIKKIISEKLSLLFGNFEVVKVSNFDMKTSARFIDIKFNGLETSQVLKKFLILFTDGNPFYLGRIASRAGEIALERPSSCIDEDILAQTILELVYHANGVIHQYLINFILTLLDTKTRENDLAILMSIADGHNTQSKIARLLKARQADASKNLARLMELGLITKNGVFYEIEDVMLAFWLKGVYRRRKELLVDGTFDKTELFRNDMLSFIGACANENRKTATGRIAELFNIFSNELVYIDSKNIRLPHFTRVDIKALQDSGYMIAASFRGNYWVAQVFERAVNENDIVNYIKNAKSFGYRISNKVLLALSGIDENAKLLAKELKISIWDNSVANKLLTYYGMKRMVIL